jgi:hypothetical protein
VGTAEHRDALQAINGTHRDEAFVEDAKFGGHVGDDDDYLLKPDQVAPLSDKY